MSLNNRYLNDLSQVDWLARIGTIFKGTWRIFRELWRGLRTQSLPLNSLLSLSVLMTLFVLRGWDARIFQTLGILRIYPRGWGWNLWTTFVSFSPFFIWAMFRVARLSWVRHDLKEVFETAGFKTSTAKTPEVLDDFASSEGFRVLRVSRLVFPLSKFKSVSESLESKLKIYISDVTENRLGGYVDFHYSKEDLPLFYEITKFTELSGSNFVVGMTRTREVVANFNDFYHLLIAGATGSGKTSFIRQLILAIYLNDPNSRFTIIDLKQGGDFSLFFDTERIRVANDPKAASYLFAKIEEEINARTALLSKEKSYSLLDLPASGETGRHIVIVDEAPNLYLPGANGSPDGFKQARAVVSRLARQGRSLGYNLIIATQRPDVKSLDPRVKANLGGTLSFFVNNHAASISALDSIAANQISKNKGRAIWKGESDFTEVQTPFLPKDKNAELLAPFKLEKPAETTRGQIRISTTLDTPQSSVRSDGEPAV